MMKEWVGRQITVDQSKKVWTVEDYSCDDESWFLHLRDNDGAIKCIIPSVHKVELCA